MKLQGNTRLELLRDGKVVHLVVTTTSMQI